MEGQWVGTGELKERKKRKGGKVEGVRTGLKKNGDMERIVRKEEREERNQRAKKG